MQCHCNLYRLKLIAKITQARMKMPDLRFVSPPLYPLILLALRIREEIIEIERKPSEKEKEKHDRGNLKKNYKTKIINAK